MFYQRLKGLNERTLLSTPWWSNVPSEEHEKVLRKVIEVLDKEGYTVVRLDKGCIPDAFYIEDGKPIAIQIEIDQSKPYARCPEFAGVLLVKRKLRHDHEGWVYAKVFELRKQGKTLRQIRQEMLEKYGVKLSVSTIHDWLRGKSIPRSIVITK